jgi:hypothetical protein
VKPGAFVRDGATKVSYGALGAYAFWLYAFGPALALLRAELNFSYAVVGVYPAVWAARTQAFALTGASVLGFGGTMVQTATQSVLSDRHGVRRDKALVEANIGAGLCAVAAPLALGVLQATPLTWRAGMALPAAALTALYLVYHRQSLAERPAGPAVRVHPARLPVTCWLLALLVGAGIGIEFCVVYSGAELLAAATRIPAATAATVMAVFYAGILAGRVGAGVLTRRPGRSIALLWASLAVTTAGFLIFWLSRHAVIALPGLFITVRVPNQREFAARRERWSLCTGVTVSRK